MKASDRSLRKSVYGYLKKKYGTEPEYLWMKFPAYAVFRHSDNNKWYCLIIGHKALEARP